MLEWTGERFLPWLEHATIAYEHLHRYAYASTFVKGKRVLDLASGEGYGARMMTETASSVVGIEIDPRVVEHAQKKYGSTTLQFVTGSICSIPLTDDHSFDVIVCFEAIEHIDDHEKLLSEVKRLLKPDGLFIVSTPNKRIYHDESGEENPFHVKELYFEEFQQLLAKHFKNIGFLGQRIHPSSSIWPIGLKSNTDFRQFILERGESEYRFIKDDARIPLYFIAVASDSAAILPPASALVDHSDGLFNEARKAVEWRNEKISSLETAVKWKDDQIADREKTIRSQESALQWREEQIKKVQEALEWTEREVAHMKEKIASHEDALAWRAHQVETLEAEKSAIVTRLQNTQRQLGLATEQLEAIYASSGWKFVLKVRHIRDSLKNLIGLGKSRGQ